MKTYISRIIMPLTVMAALGLTSCDGMDANYKKYIEDGEIVYATMPDTLYFNSGKNRVELNCRISKSPYITTALVKWDNGANSQSFDINPVDGDFAGKFIIDNLEERSYDFQVYTIDNNGHRSLPSSASCRSYGKIYEDALAATSIESLSAKGSSTGVINWGPYVDNMVANEVRYVDKDNKEQTIKVSTEERVTEIPGVKTGSGISYRSVYKPTDNCIDEFYSAWISTEDNGLTFPHSYECTDDGINRQEWDVLLCESEQSGDGDGIRATLDGNPNTYWHSGYGDNRRDIPFCIIYDMKHPYNVGEIGVMQRNGGYNFRMTKMEIYVSKENDFKGKDGNEWIRLAEISPVRSDDMQWFKVPTSVLEKNICGRYLKVVITDTWDHDGITALAEFAVKRLVSIDGKPI